MFFKQHYGFDLGTSCMHICQKEKGVVLNEPEAIAIENPGKKVVAVGDQAYDMYEKTPHSIHINMPIKYGVIADFDYMLDLLNYQCKNLKINRSGRPSALVCVPFHITEVERRALHDLFMRSSVKFRNVLMLEKPLAAGLGCNIDVLEPSGNLVVDIGGGTTEISVISLGGVVISELVKIGGEKLNIDIKNFVKRKYNVYIGLRTAERIKMRISNAMPNQGNEIELITGRDVITGLPKNIQVTSEDVYLAIKDDLMTIVDAIKMTLEKTPPELSADILTTGIHITGGTAGIKNLDQIIAKETGLTVVVNDDPINCVINGLNFILKDFHKHKKILFSLKT